MSIYEQLKSFETEQKGIINLVASENVLNSKARYPFSMDLINRYVFESSSELYFPGRMKLIDIEKECCELAAGMLNAKYVSLKPVSGLNAMLCVLGIFLKPGDVIYSIPPLYGGHNVTKYLVERIGLVSKYLPFCEATMEIDYEKLGQCFENCPPAMVYIDFMNILFNIDVKRLKSSLAKRTYLVYDASHVMALIMGNVYGNPLEDGADILVGSTHKTIPGPHKAIFATNSRIIKHIFDQRNGSFISSHHPADVYSLGILLESIHERISDYAKQVVINSKCLGKQLEEGGVPVMFSEKGYSNTHQLWVASDKLDVYHFIDSLVAHKIMANGMMIPYINRFGMRIGVQEVTFCGFMEAEMIELGKCISSIYHGNADQALENRIEALVLKLNPETYCTY